MAFLDVFSDWRDVSASVTRTIKTIANGLPTESTSTIGTYSCIGYRGTQAEQVVADKIRERVSLVLITDTSADFQPRDTVTVSNKVYKVIEADNVAYQGDAQVIALELVS